MSKNVLVKVPGFMGDTLFATTVCEELNKQLGYEVWLQTKIYPHIQYIALNPYIRGVYYNNVKYIKESLPLSYDVINLPISLTYEVPPVVQLQQYCNIPNPVNDFKLYYDYEKSSNNKIILGICNDWELKSFLFTEEEYKLGIDIPTFGYGGKHRNIEYIISEFIKQPNIDIIKLGGGLNYNYNKDLKEQRLDFDNLVSDMIKCDYVIGGEGGLTNLAYSLRIPTITTGDYVHQLYGWNGVIKKVKNPKLGNIHYGDKKTLHIELNPYLTDIQVLDKIINIINERKSSE